MAALLIHRLFGNRERRPVKQKFQRGVSVFGLHRSPSAPTSPIVDSAFRQHLAARSAQTKAYWDAFPILIDTES